MPASASAASVRRTLRRAGLRGPRDARPRATNVEARPGSAAVLAPSPRNAVIAAAAAAGERPPDRYQSARPTSTATEESMITAPVGYHTAEPAKPAASAQIAVAARRPAEDAPAATASRPVAQAPSAWTANKARRSTVALLPNSRVLTANATRSAGIRCSLWGRSR